jgi:branched-chain amino acid aminotransferase
MSASSFGLSPGLAAESDCEFPFTPRAFTMTYSPAAGWHKPQLLPVEQLAVHPGAAGLHNGQIVLEGLTAHRRIDGSIAAFRPWEHARRFRNSARGLAMPALPDDLFVSAVGELVEADAGSLDEAPGSSLYLRSVLFAADPSIGWGPSHHYGFVLMARRDHAQEHARGPSATDQLDGPNLFVVRATRPRAEVTLLEPEEAPLRGVMAESVLTLASRLGYIVRQQRATHGQWRAAPTGPADIAELAQPGHAEAEAFTCTTMAGITAITPAPNGEPGPVTEAIRRALLDIQSGREPAPRGWMYQIPSVDEP